MNDQVKTVLPAEARQATIPASEVDKKAAKIVSLLHLKLTEAMVHKPRSDYSSGVRYCRVAPTQSEFDAEMVLIGNVMRAFQELTRIDPAPAFWAGEEIAKAVSLVGLGKNTAQDDLQAIGGTLPEDFKGKAADVFFSRYITHHGTIRAHQAEAITAVGMASTMNGMIHHMARATANDIADKTLKALEGKEVDMIQIALAVAGTVAALAGTLSTAGAASVPMAAGAAAQWAKIGLATSILGTGVNVASTADSTRRAIDGSTAGTILRSMLEALADAYTQTYNEIIDLETRIAMARDNLWHMWKGNEVRPGSDEPRPPDRHRFVNGKAPSLLVVARPAGF